MEGLLPPSENSIAVSNNNNKDNNKNDFLCHIATYLFNDLNATLHVSLAMIQRYFIKYAKAVAEHFNAFWFCVLKKQGMSLTFIFEAVVIIFTFYVTSIPFQTMASPLGFEAFDLLAPTPNLHPASIFTTYINIKQGRKCTCNVTWRHVHTTIVAVENQ